MTEHLDLDDLLRAAEATLGRPPEVRDIGILEGAVARTRATVFGAEAYPDLDTKAAALLHSVVTGHALIDGNKRLGWVSVRLFYRLNGRYLRMPEDEAFDMVASIAEGSLRDVPDIAARLRGLTIDAGGDAPIRLPGLWRGQVGLGSTFDQGDDTIRDEFES